MRYGEVPASAGKVSPENKDRVIHALFRFDGAVVMVSDVPADMPATAGDNVQVNLDFDDVEDMTRKFDALAATGRVKMGLHDAFWGARFGMLVDEFGIHWMFHCATKAP
jgi:PhnB protein